MRLGHGVWINPTKNLWVDVKNYGYGRHESALCEEQFYRDIGVDGKELLGKIVEIVGDEELPSNKVRMKQDPIRILAVESGLIRLRDKRGVLYGNFAPQDEATYDRWLLLIHNIWMDYFPDSHTLYLRCHTDLARPNLLAADKFQIKEYFDGCNLA